MKVEEKAGKLVISDFDEFEAYRIASNIEEDGINFYKMIAERAINPEVRETLEFLLDEEEKHLEFFSDCLDAIRQEKEDVSKEDDSVTSIDFGIFQPYKRLEDMEKIITNIEKALSLGVVIENKSIEFYAACRLHITNEETKEKISNIIEEEMRHKDKFIQLMRQAKG